MVAILANITNDRKGSMEASALILAAGAGTRMKSSKPKVAHKILEKPLIRWVVDAAHGAGIESVVTVVGHGRELVEPLVEDTQVVVQEEQLGTAHAVKTAREVLAQTPGPARGAHGRFPAHSTGNDHCIGRSTTSFASGGRGAEHGDGGSFGLWSHRA